MAMKRICPFCKSHMQTNSVYFCTSCGNVLPESLQLRNLSFRKSITLVFGKKKKERKSSKELISKVLKDIPTLYLLLGVLSFLLIIIGFVFLVRYSNSRISEMVENRSNVVTQESTPNKVLKPSSDSNLKDEKSKGSSETNLNIKIGDFGQNDIYDYVPYDADFYVEVNDTSTLSSYFGFMGGEFFTLVEGIKNNLNQSYAAFFIDNGVHRDWVIIVFPVDKDIDLSSYSKLNVKLVDKALVISNEPGLVTEVSNSKSGIAKSLSLNPLFINMKSDIPKKGKLLLLSLTDEGKSVVTDIVRDTSSDELKSIVKEFESTKSNYLFFE